MEAEIRKTIPAEDVEMIIDNIGVPSEQYNMAFGDSATLGTNDGEILIALKHERKKGAPAYAADLRTSLHAAFPHLTFYFQPADIVSQILNFGLKSPIDVRIAGYNKAANLADRPRVARPDRAASPARSTCICTRMSPRRSCG